METAANKASRNFAKELEDELLKYTVNHEDISKIDAPLLGQMEEVSTTADVEVNLTDCTNSLGNGIFEVECHDTIENSSSFDDSDSGVDNEDTEVVSHFHGEAASAVEFNDGFGEMFRMRKKKLTTSWRSFVQPLVWRCKWTELQIKKLQLQAQKYDRELAEYTQTKQLQSNNLALEDGVKSIPFSSNNARCKVLRRKRRRRIEATVDLEEYMSRHNLFSYFENRQSSDASVMKDELRNPAIATERVGPNDDFLANDELQLLGSRDDNNSLQHVLQKIGFLQSRVRNMKSRINKVMSENAGKLLCTDDTSLLMPSNVLMGSPRNTAFSNSGDRMPVGSSVASQLVAEYNVDDNKHEASVLSLGNASDVIESTDQSLLGDSCKTAEDDVLVDNERVKEKMNNFGEIKIEAIQRPLVLEDGSGSSLPLDPDLPTDDQPPPKLRSISKLTTPKTRRRRRGRRRGAGQWSRRASC